MGNIQMYQNEQSAIINKAAAEKKAKKAAARKKAKLKKFADDIKMSAKKTAAPKTKPAQTSKPNDQSK